MASTSDTMTTRARRTFILLAMAAMASAQGTYSPVGCYSSVSSLKFQGTDTYQSYGNCYTACKAQNAAVMALTDGNACYCGNSLPAASAKTSSSSCDTACQGYPANTCGGSNAFSVLLTGLGDPPTVGGGSGGGSSSSSSSTSSADTSPAPTSTTSIPSSSPTSPTRTRQGGGGGGQTVVTSVGPATTVVVTQQAASGSGRPKASSNSGGSTNIGAIAGGVVVGVLAVTAIVAGVFFYLRRRRQNAAEEEYKRTQISDFMRHGERKAPGTAYSQMSDSRLDPEAGARRDSQGSIADNQDYSRRILRVANPDGS